jgi:hypothetical protein
MRSMVYRALTFAALLSAGAMGGSLVARAQPAAPAPDVMAALLVEVRGLRTAMEQMATAGPRVQLVLGRVQLQEQRILNQTRRLDSVVGNLVQMRRQLAPLTDRIKEVTQSLDSPLVDPETRRGRENELAMVKAEWARMNAEVQRLAAEETFLMQELGGEQNRWTDFNLKLEELERALAQR